MSNKMITSRDVDFAKWYTDVVKVAHLCEYSSVKGCMIIEPNGYAIWENIQNILNKKFKETGHKNVYLPCLIPESLMKKESELINGFAPEVAWVTKGGQKELEERMCIRPTSETLFSDYYSNKIKSYRDLPLKYNQWANVIRWEKETRPFLRSREFLWQEGHTIHSTKEEAEKETLDMLNIYKSFFEEYLAIPVISGKKTEREKFSGAEYTLTLEALMYNGISLQSATSHYFGQKFSKSYNIQFLNKNNELEYAYQTSWGTTTRMIGALIMVHSDDDGLVLPPKIAPTKVAIISIGNEEEIIKLSTKIKNELMENNIETYIDETEKSPGFKFAETEVNGIPFRIEIGMRDLKNNKITISRRDTKEKYQIEKDCNIVEFIKEKIEEMQKDMFNKAKKRRDNKTYECKNLDEVKDIMKNNPGFVKAMWCGDEHCELEMKNIYGTKSRCILDDNVSNSGRCIVCQKESKNLVLWGIQY